MFNGVPFTAKELQFFKENIVINVCESLHILLQTVEETEGTLSNANLGHYQTFYETYHAKQKRISMPLLEDFALGVSALWNDPVVRNCVEMASKLTLQDTAATFLNDAERILALNYTPTEQDILFLRSPTSAISENEFIMEGKNVVVYDVCGQKSLRKAW